MNARMFGLKDMQSLKGRQDRSKLSVAGLILPHPLRQKSSCAAWHIRHYTILIQYLCFIFHRANLNSKHLLPYEENRETITRGGQIKRTYILDGGRTVVRGIGISYMWSGLPLSSTRPISTWTHSFLGRRQGQRSGLVLVSLHMGLLRRLFSLKTLLEDIEQLTLNSHPGSVPQPKTAVPFRK